ncbi:hypothetical protein DN595_01855 [Enterobacter cloacae]|uniref:Uncharacterized protein n=2 Tax=Enterobacter cloacae TaxID=550 RepID=A0AB37VJ70_ENTCL|nr:hypothetical protein C1N69_13945 [Enterobacter sichuanensis]RWT81166.1 hypothetical protein DN595_09005 [Enterobacter cloacae]RWT84577.1 hypothetical protein DN595_01855 [Enterobacter cloacae]
MPWSGCKSPKRFRKAGARRRDAPRGRGLQGCRLMPDPIAWRNKLRVPRSGDLPPGARVARAVAIEPPWHVHWSCCYRVALNIK